MKAQHLVDLLGSVALRTTACLMWIAYFFLYHLGEYYFCLYLAGKVLNLGRAPNASLRPASCAMLEFTDQNNSSRGKKTTQCHSGHPVASTTRTIADQAIHLQQNTTGPTTPLCVYKRHDQWFLVTPPMVTNLLCQAAAHVSADYEVKPADISAHSFQASSAMAMLCAGIDSTKTLLMGCWNSDSMMD